MDMIQVKALLAQLVAAVNEPPAPITDTVAPFGHTRDGRPAFAPAYDACRTMLRAAEREGVFAITALLGGGIKPGAAQMYEGFQPNLVLIEESIVALGLGPWGQEWLKDFGNRATVSAEYVRRFGFTPVTRKNDGTLVEVG